jgi:hypothetical protein
MALQLSYNDAFGNTNSTAYFRVVTVNNDHKNLVCGVNVEVYKDATARQSLKSQLASFNHSTVGDEYATYFGVDVLDLANHNIIKQGYTYLKSLAEYSGASDV